MKLTIKNLKFAEFASEETLCFECSVYVDGKRAFAASNNGHGGCNSYSTYGIKDGKELLAEVKAWVAEQPSEYCEELDFDYQPDLDQFVFELVTAELVKRDYVKAYRKGVAFLPEQGSDEVRWFGFRSGLSAETKARLREVWKPQVLEKYPSAVFINADGTLEDRA